MTDSKYVLFLDLVGRLILGTKVSETDDVIGIQNPLIVHADTNAQGGFSVQFFPVMLREFQAAKNDPTVWKYFKKNITIADDLMLDLRLTSQYEKIFEPIKNVMPVVQQAPNPNALVPAQPAKALLPPTKVNLFDDK